MRRILLAVLLGALAGSGCFGKKGGSAPKNEPPPAAFSAVPVEPPPAQPAQPTPPAAEPTQPAAQSTAQPTQPSAQPTPPAQTAAEPKPKLIVTPENALTGKVVKVNAAARFVVLSFPIGHLPAIEQRLNVNRRGLKVGEVKVTGPQQEENIVADIVAGDAEEGDEVSDK